MEYLEGAQVTVATVASYYSITLKFNELFRSRFESILVFFFFFSSLLSSWFISSTSDIQSLSEL